MKVIPAKDGSYVVGDWRIAHIPTGTYESDDEFKELVDSCRTAVDTPPREMPKTYNVTVLTSTGCNLACPYCFQNVAPETNGRPSPRIPLRNLDLAVIKDIRTFVQAQISKFDLDGATLLLFGGEPLLRYPQCVDLLEAFGDLPLQLASLQTNGTLLSKARLETLRDRGVRRLHITFDGDETHHNQSRYYRNHRGSYRVILKKLESCTDVDDVRWRIRLNVDLRSLDTIEGVVDDLASCLPTDRTTVYLAPLMDYGQGSDQLVQSVEGVVARMADLYRYILSCGFQPLPVMERGCGYCAVEGGRSGAVIGPDGGLYSCWDTAGKGEFRVGDVVAGYDETLVSDRWHHCGDIVEVQGQRGSDLYTRLGSELQLFWLEEWASRQPRDLLLSRI